MTWGLDLREQVQEAFEEAALWIDAEGRALDVLHKRAYNRDMKQREYSRLCQARRRRDPVVRAREAQIKREKRANVKAR